jgi:hypothetical protein
MSISARVVADSMSPDGRRLTTFVLTYPRFIHAEFMTHRVFSRNAASSRAIPAKKIRASVRLDPAWPIYWGKNQPGMSAEAELDGWRLRLVKFLLFTVAMRFMLAINWLCEKLGLHKQIANRYLEPWFNITVVVSATNWSNFYHLRNHAKAQPEIRRLAEVMLEAQNQSIPTMLQFGQWHLPFIEAGELAEWGYEKALHVSVARCARVSYMNHEGKRSTYEEDLALYKRLLAEEPKHASPAEHQGTPIHPMEVSGNFVGWGQYRKLIENEFLSYYPGLTIQ